MTWQEFEMLVARHIGVLGTPFLKPAVVAQMVALILS